MVDLREISAEELVGEFGRAVGRVGIHADVTMLRAELLRRLSAGNPHGEQVQIAHFDGCILVHGQHAEQRTDPDAYMRQGETRPEPERSDGRIQAGSHPNCSVKGCGLCAAIDALARGTLTKVIQNVPEKSAKMGSVPHNQRNYKP